MKSNMNVTLSNSKLIDLSQKYGIPLYVYDGDKIQSQYNRFKQSFSSVEKLKIHYAVKALSNISILSFIKKLGAGIDCVSLEEIRLGLLAGFSPKDIIYTPNGVSF